MLFLESLQGAHSQTFVGSWSSLSALLPLAREGRVTHLFGKYGPLFYFSFNSEPRWKEGRFIGPFTRYTPPSIMKLSDGSSEQQDSNQSKKL